MKTITEFDATRLKNASKIQQELQTAGKPAEELPQAIGESLKLEGDALNFILNALAVADGSKKKLNDLKRVVVFSLSEGEKAPYSAQQKGDHYYVLEYYPPLRSKQAPQEKVNPKQGRDARGGRNPRDQKNGKRDDKNGKNRRDRSDQNRGDQNERGNRRPRPERRPLPVLDASGNPKPLPVIKPRDATPKETPPTTS